MEWGLFITMLNKSIFLLLATIIFIHIYVLTKLIFFPYPELFVYPYLTNHGLKPYSQILDQHFPGLMFLPINFDNLGMTNESVARIWLISIVVIIHVLLFLISNAILKNSKKALLVNILYLIWQPFFEGWVLWIDNFLPLILLPAFYTFFKDKFFISGILVGLAVVFKQVMIPLAILLAFYVWWESKEFKKLRDFFIGLSLPIFLMIIYLVSIGVFNDFFYWTVIFNLTIYAKYGRGERTDFAHLFRVVLVFGSAFLAVGKIKERSVQVLLIFLIGSLVGLTTRFDFVHFQPALPFAILATILGIGKFKRLGIIGKVAVIVYLLIAAWWINIFYKGHIENKVFFFDPETKMIAQKIRQYTKVDEKIFIFGLPPNLYQMADRLPAGNIFVFQFPWFLKIAETRILEGLMEDKPNIVVSERTAKIEGVEIAEFADKIDKYIQQNYEVIDNVGTKNILRRKGF